MTIHPYRICFLCTGNICRSPIAAVVLASRAAAEGWSPSQLVVDSAGTGGWHVGEGMDRRALAALARRGYDGKSHRAKRFERKWIEERDLVVALDLSHLHFLEQLSARRAEAEIRLLLDGAEVPDPYWGDAQDFDECLALIESGIDAMLPELAGRLGVAAP